MDAQDKTLTFEKCCKYFNDETILDEDLDQIKRDFLKNNPTISLDVFKQLVPYVIDYDYKFVNYDRTLTLEKLQYILETYPEIDRSTEKYRITFEFSVFNSEKINSTIELFESIVLHFSQHFKDIGVKFHRFVISEFGPKLTQYQLDEIISVLATKIVTPEKILRRALEEKCDPEYIKKLLEILNLNNINIETIAKSHFNKIYESPHLLKVFSEYIDIKILTKGLLKTIPDHTKNALIIFLESGVDLLSALKE
jgi:hypothetical protein